MIAIKGLLVVGAAMAVGACGSSGGTRGGVDETTLLSTVDAISNSQKCGSDGWDISIKGALVNAADANGSGDLDTAAEVTSIPCSIWLRMDVGMRQDYGSPFMQIYGFHPQLIWVGSAVGINESLRPMATNRLAACGLDTAMQ